ncbi:MAG: tetratricopeptide repeat protein [Rhodospirillales bacterium]|nr:tetratricopeptide repeat protein [Rhodospirillales bacterium]
MSSDLFDQALKSAIDLHQAGRLREAIAGYRRVLERQPDRPDALNFLGMALSQAGDAEAGIAALKRAAAAAPKEAITHNNLGEALRMAGRLDEAAKALETAIKRNPGLHMAHNSLGLVRRDQKRLDDAIFHLRRATQLEPRHESAWMNLGHTFLLARKIADARTAFGQILSHAPGHPDALYGIGLIEFTDGNYDEAVAALQQALAQRGDDLDARLCLGRALHRLGRLNDAEVELQRVVESKTDSALGYGELAACDFLLCRHADAIASLRRAIELQPEYTDFGRQLLYVLAADPDQTADSLFAEAKSFAARYTRNVQPLPPIGEWDRNPDRRLRIGWISSDFRRHPVGTYIEMLMAGRDRNRYAAYCYSGVERPDEITTRLQAAADGWRDIAHVSDGNVAATIRNDRIDILVVLAGRMDDNRPLVVAWRPAPLHVSIYDTGTSGLSEMDYFVTDAVLTPKDTSERFTEKLIYLPRFFAHRKLGEIEPLHRPPMHKSSQITFGSFNNQIKLNYRVAALWAEILRLTPNSRLALRYSRSLNDPGIRSRIVSLFADVGISPDRLALDGRHEEHKIHLDRYNWIDVALDPFPFTGSTTTFEALWMGVPVVTLAGETWGARMSASILTAAGSTELIAHSPEEYVAKVMALANAPARLAEYRASLRNRLLASPLMDVEAYTRNFEAAMRDAWRRWCAQSSA